MKLPKIKENLLVQDLADEVLVFDKATNKSYCLNSTARTVFNSCDGKKVFADISLPNEIIYFSLDELKRQNLIEDDYVSPFAGTNRREVIKKVGLASMIALPVIVGLVAPTAAQAASSCSASQLNLPSGCEAGYGFAYPGTCDSTSVAYKNDQCSNQFRGKATCASRNATYSGTCFSVNGGSSYVIRCMCT